MTFKSTLLVLAISSSLLAACSEQASTETSKQTSKKAEKTTAVDAMSESEKANQLFDAIFDENVLRSPMTQTYLGIKTDYDKWDDLSEKNTIKELAFTKANLQRVKNIDSSKLDEQTLISYSLLVQKLENEISDQKWRIHNNPVNQMFGVQSNAPSLLINQHLISDISDAKAYINRLNTLPDYFDQVIEEIKVQP